MSKDRLKEIFSLHSGCMLVSSFIKVVVIIGVMNLLPVTSSAQQNFVDCASLRNGTFYFYPKNTKDKYIDVRDGDYMHETNTTNGDTSLWKINWTNDCHYSLTYLSGTEKITAHAAKFMTKHKWVYEISNVTSEYYLFKNFLDKTTNLPVQDDTIWLHEKTIAINNELFSRIADSATSATPTINDTSKYALVYLYRPGHVLACLRDYLLYFDNNILWVATNNSGAVFKIIKEGTYELGNRLYKGNSVVRLNIKFGNTYYVQSTIDWWGVHENLYNYKLNNILVNEKEGKSEFSRVRLR